MNALWSVIAMVLAAATGVSMSGMAADDVRAVWLGIAAPVVMAATSWTITTKTWARDQAALLPVMLRAFAVKAMFVVAYVVVMLKVFDARPRAFVLSFSVAYLATHLAEAYCLRRLMAAR